MTEHDGSGTCDGSHVYADDDAYTVSAEVCRGDQCDGATTSHTVNNVAPAVDAPAVAPSPSNEGESVVASASFSDARILDSHTCTVDYGDGAGPQPGTVDGSTCTGPAHTYADDHPDGYLVTIEVCDNGGDCGQAGTIHTVLNLPPVIHEIGVSDAGLGDPLTVTVDASDPGINDVLSYEFDCDGDGAYEVGPQEANSTVCPGDATRLTLVIGVRVSDGDGGVAEGAVTVSFSQVYRANSTIGQLTLRPDGCLSYEQELVLEAGSAVTLCANRGTGQLRYMPAGCPGGWQTHVVPGPAPLLTCWNSGTGGLRVTATGTCTAHEILHVIPAA